MRGSAAAALSAIPPHVSTVGEVVHRGHEVLGIYVGGCHVAGRAARLAREAGLEGDGQVARLSQVLSVQAAGLLLYGAERPAHREGG